MAPAHPRSADGLHLAESGRTGRLGDGSCVHRSVRREGLSSTSACDSLPHHPQLEAADRVQSRMDHWASVLESAAEQCGRSFVPSISSPLPIAEWLKRLRAPEKKGLLDLAQPPSHERLRAAPLSAPFCEQPRTPRPRTLAGDAAHRQRGRLHRRRTAGAPFSSRNLRAHSPLRLISSPPRVPSRRCASVRAFCAPRLLRSPPSPCCKPDMEIC